MNLPNLITLARLLSVPLIVYLISQELMTVAFWMFFAAGISDAVDGYLAKRLNAETELGMYLDPLADKVLLVAVYVSLGMAGHLPTWLVILAVSRDLLIVGGALLSYAMELKFKIRPWLISKINTCLQITLAALVLSELGGVLSGGPIIEGLILAVGVTTVASGAGYLFVWLRGQSVGEAR